MGGILKGWEFVLHPRISRDDEMTGRDLLYVRAVGVEGGMEW